MYCPFVKTNSQFNSFLGKKERAYQTLSLKLYINCQHDLCDMKWQHDLSEYRCKCAVRIH